MFCNFVVQSSAGFIAGLCGPVNTIATNFFCFVVNRENELSCYATTPMRLIRKEIIQITDVVDACCISVE